MLAKAEFPRTPPADRLQIGAWTVEPALNRLSAAGRSVRLEPKSMAVLLYLASRPGQVVSREALLSAVWQGVVVGEDSVTQVMLKLRRALGDAPHIETISKGGYRLVAPVRQAAFPATAGNKQEGRWPAAALAAILMVVAAAGMHWTKSEPAPSARQIRNPQAYEHFQRGQVALQQHHQEGTEPARKLFWRAIQLDANFARAYSGLAMTHVLDYRRQQGSQGSAALDRAFELALTALQIDSGIPDTYRILASVHEHRRQHPQAMQHLETALKLFPSYADGYALMGSVYTHMGRPEETVPLVRTAMRLNPDGQQRYFVVLGRAYLFLGDLEQARVNLEEAVKRNPGTVEARVYLATAYVAAGDKTSADWQAEEIRAIFPGFSAHHWVEATPLSNPDQRAKLHDALAVLKL